MGNSFVPNRVAAGKSLVIGAVNEIAPSAIRAADPAEPTIEPDLSAPCPSCGSRGTVNELVRDIEKLEEKKHTRWGEKTLWRNGGGIQIAPGLGGTTCGQHKEPVSGLPAQQVARAEVGIAVGGRLHTMLICAGCGTARFDVNEVVQELRARRKALKLEVMSAVDLLAEVAEEGGDR